MLDILFGRLTGARSDTGAFDALTRLARQPHWYLEGGVADTIDGRFALLATVTALAIVRLEQCGDAGEKASVQLVERFIEVMESEHRELGLGDPALGKTVRKLVSSLERRTGLWRAAVGGNSNWAEATRDSLFKGKTDDCDTDHAQCALGELWTRIATLSVAEIEQGRIA